MGLDVEWYADRAEGRAVSRASKETKEECARLQAQVDVLIADRKRLEERIVRLEKFLVID